MSTLAATIAANRFGLGARPGELGEIGGAGYEWLLSQIKPQAPLTALENSAVRFKRLLGGVENMSGIAAALRPARDLYIKDMTLRTQQAVTTAAPFAERLVHFWSNHFAVSVERVVVGPFVAAYENEAIRPNIFGKFSDMVLASARHVAMLTYLDNVRSIGPNSRAVQRRVQEREQQPRGLNENYAREVMELHTLGVDGGYTQADVLSLAKILTGWSLNRREGGFEFKAVAHEPGVHTVMGTRFADNGEQQGIAALRFLAAHTATAKHIATKLARHFIADEPPASAVDALASTFTRSGGDLAVLTRTLIDLQEAWQPQQLKYKSPQEHVISSLRAIGSRTIEPAILSSFEVLGQRSFGAPSPQGWPDKQANWLSGDGLMRRIEWSQALAKRLPSTLDARRIAADVLGPWLSGDTAFMLQGAPSNTEALALLFLAPEFQRR